MSTMELQKALTALALGVMIAVPTMLPADAQAKPQSHRQKEKNNWRNLGIAGGAVGVAGLLTHNKTLAIAGLAGGGYSAYRYEKARKDQSRERSHYYSKHHRTYRHSYSRSHHPTRH